MASIPQVQLEKAVGALFAFLNGEHKAESETKSSKQSLFEKEEDFSIIFTLRKVPQHHSNTPIRLPIPHTIYGREGISICFFSKDPKEKYEAMFQRSPVRNIKEVVTVKEVQTDYKAFQHRRELMSRNDFFLADKTVAALVSHHLGAKFFVAKKHPYGVDISGSDWKKQVEAARDSTYMFLSMGSTVAIKVGHSSLTKKQIIENINAIIPLVAEKIPNGWKNVQAIGIKTATSFTLPLYNRLATADDFIPTEKDKEILELDEQVRATKAEKNAAEKLDITLQEYRAYKKRADKAGISVPALLKQISEKRKKTIEEEAKARAAAKRQSLVLPPLTPGEEPEEEEEDAEDDADDAEEDVEEGDDDDDDDEVDIDAGNESDDEQEEERPTFKATAKPIKGKAAARAPAPAPAPEPAPAKGKGKGKAVAAATSTPASAPAPAAAPKVGSKRTAVEAAVAEEPVKKAKSAATTTTTTTSSSTSTASTKGDAKASSKGDVKASSKGDAKASSKGSKAAKEPEAKPAPAPAPASTPAAAEKKSTAKGGKKAGKA